MTDIPEGGGLRIVFPPAVEVSEVCSPRANNTVLGGESTDADYVFDRDGWKVNVPYLGGAAPGAPDVLVPPFLAAHFDPTFHYNWSDYLLVSTPGSGLHFHRHPTAYNGLVYGRKRWFFYPASVTQRPEFDVSALEWFRTRARREDNKQLERAPLTVREQCGRGAHAFQCRICACAPRPPKNEPRRLRT